MVITAKSLLGKCKWLCAIVLCVLVQDVSAQYYTSGTDPFGVRWMQIRGNGYRIVCDTSMAGQMRRMAVLMDSVTTYGGKSLNWKPKSIDILMHSRIAYSNGLVAWAPSRMELYSYAAPDNDCVPWLEHVTLHEYRHVVQMSSLNRGFSKVLYCLMGEQALGLVTGAYIPKWLLEGDAVYAETALKNGGRGRRAEFVQEIRADVLTRGIPSYEQSYFGSYKRELPDYYRMGYLTVAAAREKYGLDIWANAFELVGRKSWSITPFYRSLKQQTGTGKKGIYLESYEYWRKLWEAQDASIVTTEKSVLSERKNDYASYVSPKVVGDEIVAVKKSPDEVEHFVAIDSTRSERQLFVASARNSSDYSVHGDTIVWSERRAHVRWEQAGKGVVMMYDMGRKKKKKVTRKGMLESPDVAPDGKRFVAVETMRDGRQHLVVYDFEGKKQTDHSIGIEENIDWPRWTDDRHVAAVLTTSKGREIRLWDMQTGASERLTEPAYENVRQIEVADGVLYFTSDADGNDNIYSLSLEKGARPERITSSHFGAAWSSVKDGVVRYSDLTPQGYDAVATSTSTRATDTPLQPMKDVARSLAQKEGVSVSPDTTAAQSQTTEKNYSRWNLFRLHSWMPFAFRYDDYDLGAGATLMSQNLLGSMTVNAGVKLGSEETDEMLFADITYSGLFPKITLSATLGYDDYEMEGYTSSTQGMNGTMYYDYLVMDDRQTVASLDLTVQVPLSFNSGAWSRRVTPYFVGELDHYGSIDYQTCMLVGTPRGYYVLGDWEDQQLDATNYASLGYGLQFYMLRRTATRDVGTRLGFLARALYRHTPIGTDIGDIASGSLTLYVPSPFRHHRFMLYGAAQKKTVAVSESGGVSYYGDDISRARGYSKVANSEMRTFSAQYDMPLLNPDLSLGPILHIKRVNLSAFYDYSEGKTVPLTGESYDFDMSSIGAQLTFELYALRLPYPITLGYRHCYRTAYEDWDAGISCTISF